MEAEEREDYLKAEELVAHAAALRREVEEVERASGHLSRELERLSDVRLALYGRQAALWVRGADEMGQELSRRQAAHERESVGRCCSVLNLLEKSPSRAVYVCIIDTHT